MEAIAALMSRTIKTDVTQCSSAKVTIDPIRKDPLFAMAKLTSAGEDAAAIDPDWKIESLAVFECDRFGRELGCAVKRNGSGRRKFFADALRAHPFSEASRWVRLKRVAFHGHRNLRERFHRVNPASAEKNEPRSEPFCNLEQVNRRRQVIFDELPATSRSIDSGEHAGIRGGVDDPIYGRKRFQITCRSKVAV